MKKTLIPLLASFIFISIYAFDPSTPKNGNLYSKHSLNLDQTNPKLYSINSLNEKKHPLFKNGRLFETIENMGAKIPKSIGINIGSDVVTTPEGYHVALTGNGNRYNHRIFGPKKEATGFVVIKNGQVTAKYELSGKRIFETLRPLIADIIPENPGSEILLTASDSDQGARLEIYSMTGAFIGSSEAIGKGYRWMHLLAVAPFGPNGEIEIATVRTPHIGGILEYYRWNGKELIKTASLEGVSTHRINSNNLNMAIAADFTGNHKVELFLPSQDFRTLILVKRIQAGVTMLKTIPLNGELNTNLMITTYPKKSLWLGTNNNTFTEYGY